MRAVSNRLNTGMDVAKKQTQVQRKLELLGRLWLTPDYNNGTLNQAGRYVGSITPPAGCRWVRATCIGHGGQTYDTQNFDSAGGPADWVQSTFQIASGDTLAYQIPTASGGSTIVSQVQSGNATDRVFAQQGAFVTQANPFPGPNTRASSLAGDIVRNGTAGSGSGSQINGSRAYSDPQINPINNGGRPNIPAEGYGGGVVVQQSGVDSRAVTPGSGALICIEFWSVDPR